MLTKLTVNHFVNVKAETDYLIDWACRTTLELNPRLEVAIKLHNPISQALTSIERILLDEAWEMCW